MLTNISKQVPIGFIDNIITILILIQILQLFNQLKQVIFNDIISC